MGRCREGSCLGVNRPQCCATRFVRLAVQLGERDSGLRLAELVAVFSLAMDLGLGQPMEHVLRSWLIAARLGDHLGVAREQRGALYYVVTLAWVGCVADTPEVANWFGDDIAYRGDSYRIDMTGLPLLGFMLGHAGAGKSALDRRTPPRRAHGAAASSFCSWSRAASAVSGRYLPSRWTASCPSRLRT